MASTPRGVVAVDRVVTLLAGLVLIVGGAAAFAWHQGYLASGIGSLRTDVNRISFPWMTDATSASWWPWAAGAIGLVLAVLALVWLGRHVTGSRVSTLRLPGSGGEGSLRVDVGAAAKAAADELVRHDDIRSCRSSVSVERGQIVALLEPTLEPSADLAEVTAAAEAAGGKLVGFVGRDDLTYRVQLKVARREHAENERRVQ
ncbi:hypothetical protein [Terracoccus luteus]|jgi:hypothetical protein|uniref:Uncharacterized protein n=1 Tax=Terracoccus luteus TaxID=53356 RepID=A0A839Q5B4_9MICO|nr:hypothetical protein [Terracoccus luteus]MBB2988382.1 hypothetical protein [Terracoccus luteus]MCP2173988.1 hypothetical protein [Terracoccus luteus]